MSSECGIALCNIYFRKEENTVSRAMCEALAEAYRSTFAIECLDLDKLLALSGRFPALRQGSHRLHVEFDCAAKHVLGWGHAGEGSGFLLTESVISRLSTSADWHVGIGISTPASPLSQSNVSLPVSLASCVAQSLPSASIVVGNDELAGLNRSSQLLRQALHEVWRWPTLVERLPKKYAATGLTTSQELRLFQHCAELPLASQARFTLLWINESALQVRCSDVKTTARRHDRSESSTHTSSVSSRFLTGWHPMWNHQDDGRLWIKEPAVSRTGDFPTFTKTGDLSSANTWLELAQLGKGFLPGIDADPLGSGHVLSKVSCCNDDGSLRWHGSALTELVEPSGMMSPLLQLRSPTHF